MRQGPCLDLVMAEKQQKASSRVGPGTAEAVDTGVRSLCAGLHQGFGQQRRTTASSHHGTSASAHAARKRRRSTLMMLARDMIIITIDHHLVKIRKAFLGRRVL